MTTVLDGWTRGSGFAIEYVVVPMEAGSDPAAAARSYRRFAYGTTGGPSAGFWDVIEDLFEPPISQRVTTVGATLAGHDHTFAAGIGGDDTITSVTYTPVSAMTGVDVNSRTLSLVNTGPTGAGTTVVATLELTSGNDADGETEIPLSVVAGATAIDDGDRLAWHSTHVGANGIATVGHKALTSGVATLTTAANHGFLAGQTVVVAGVDSTFNGTYVIADVPSADTFTYDWLAAEVVSAPGSGTADVADAASVTNKALTNNVATLTTSAAHRFQVADTVVVAGVDGTFDGTVAVTAVTSDTFDYDLVHVDVVSAPASGTATGDLAAVVTNKELVDNVATLTTDDPHRFLVGDSVVVAAVDATFNGTHTISAVTSDTFSWAITHANVVSAVATGTADVGGLADPGGVVTVVIAE